MRRIGRHTDYADAELLGSLYVHIVETGTAQGYQLHAIARHTLNDTSVALCIDEDTHGVGSLSQRNGIQAETLFVVLNVETEVLIHLGEVLAVVALRIEKRYSYCHNLK